MIHFHFIGMNIEHNLSYGYCVQAESIHQREWISGMVGGTVLAGRADDLGLTAT